MAIEDDPYLPTDVSSFYVRKIPCLNFFTGSHELYHHPGDDPETLNYEGLLRISELAYRMISETLTHSDRLDYAEVKDSSTGGDRDSLRAYLGTIPDYGNEIE